MLCTEELFLRLSVHSSGKYDTFSGPSWISHLPAGPQNCRFPTRMGFSIQLDNKAVFSIPGDTERVELRNRARPEERVE
jgi:hypothetical protein